jgi:osmotically-inducible protein OsmY
MQTQGEDVLVRVLNALHWDFALPRHRLNVEVENGWVTVSGVVDRPYQKSCAESDVRKVPGVVGVINHIEISSAQTAEAEPAQH